MPDGRIHASISAAAAVGLYWACAQAGLAEAGSQAVAVGCLMGMVITPDLDVDQPVRSHYLVFRRFGPVVAALWRMVWLPYGLAIRHRSWVSHLPVVGTIIRAAYLACIGALVRWAAGTFGDVPFPTKGLMPLVPWLLVGLAVSDALHWASDILFTASKRRRRQKALRSGA
jgi:uncharacterized metal-binding protein